MNELQVFNFENKEVRTIVENGEPWFVAKDVALALRYERFDSHLVDKVPEEWKGTKPIRTTSECEVNPIHTPSRARKTQEMLCLSEPGLYFFLGRSDKPAALPFQKLVAGEVMPSIRKKGFYAVPGREPPQESGAWNYYPFFNESTFAERAELIKWLYTQGIMSRDEVRLEVLGHANQTAIAEERVIGAEMADAARQKRKLNPAITGFAEKFFDITGLEDDFILVQVVYDKFREAAGSQTTRNVFVRQLKDVDTRIVYKQKKISGLPELVFYGVRFKRQP
jgi:prophage antirepressor-like protein